MLNGKCRAGVMRAWQGKARLLLVLSAAALLSACYTNVNQAWFRKEYSGYLLDYSGEEKSGRALAPALYRCGDDWYIAGIKSYVRDRDWHVHAAWNSYEERHRFALTPLAGRPVYYHKITPGMAKLLMASDQAVYAQYTAERLKADMRQAGGSWEPALPPGARRVSAAFLKHGHTSISHVEAVDTRSAWYAYPMAGLTFLCVDVPCSAALTAVTTVAYLALNDDDDDDDDWVSSSMPSGKKKKAAPPSKQRRGHHAHGKHHHEGEHEHGEHRHHGHHKKKQ